MKNLYVLLFLQRSAVSRLWEGKDEQEKKLTPRPRRKNAFGKRTGGFFVVLTRLKTLA
jgi:hypothetical protein